MENTLLSYSEFDSNIFGVNFFRVSSSRLDGLAEQLELEKSRGALIVDAKVPAGDRESELNLVNLGFRKITTLIELFAPVSAPKEYIPEPDLMHGLTLNSDEIREHGRQFVFQRFRQDPMIPPEDAIRFMEAWIRNSLGGRSQVFAIGRNFLTYRIYNNEIELELMSCLDRNRGVATRLVAAAKVMSSEIGLPMRTATEAENMPPMRVHLSHGFLPAKATLVFHLVNGRRTLS